MVFVDIRDGRDHGREIEKRRVRLIGFRYEEFARAEPCVGTRRVELTADHEGRIESARRKERGNERGRCRLAVRARNGDAAAQAHEFGKHHRARYDGDAEFARRNDFRIVVLDGRRDHHGVCAANVALVVTERDARAEALQPLGDGALGDVRAAHDVPEIEEHLGDAAHACAADADEVKMIDQKLQFDLPFL